MQQFNVGRGLKKTQPFPKMAKRKRQRRRRGRQRRFDVERIGGPEGRTAPASREQSPPPEYLIQKRALLSGKLGHLQSAREDLGRGEIGESDFQRLMRGFNAEIMQDQRTEVLNPLGHLASRRLITEAQRKAGEKFAAIDQWLCQALEIPKRSAKISNIGGPGGRAIREIDPDKEERAEGGARAAWNDALAALMNAGAGAVKAVTSVCIHREHPGWFRIEGPCPMTRDRLALQNGLNALADLYGLEDAHDRSRGACCKEFLGRGTPGAKDRGLLAGPWRRLPSED